MYAVEAIGEDNAIPRVVNAPELDAYFGIKPHVGAELIDGRKVVELIDYVDDGEVEYVKAVLDDPERSTVIVQRIGDLWFWHGAELIHNPDFTFNTTDFPRTLRLWGQALIPRATALVIVDNERDAKVLGNFNLNATAYPTGFSEIPHRMLKALATTDVTVISGPSQQSKRDALRLTSRLYKIKKQQNAETDEPIRLKLFEPPFDGMNDGLADGLSLQARNKSNRWVSEWLAERIADLPYWSPRAATRSLVRSIRQYHPDDEKFEFIIPGVLPEQGKLTFSAPAKFGKTWFAMQLGLSIASGNCRFLNWDISQPRRVLMLQVELTNAMARKRLDELLSMAPPDFDRTEAEKNFFIFDVRLSAPDLSSPEGREVLDDMIEASKPDLVIIDPFSQAYRELIENAAESMRDCLLHLSDVTANHRCAVLLVHHIGKGAGSPRGSSMFAGWGDGDIVAGYADDKDKKVGKLSLNLRCSNRQDPMFVKLPDTEDLWFELMESSHRERPGIADRNKITPDRVADILSGYPNGLPYGKLLDCLKRELHIGESKAKLAIRDARDAGRIEKAGNGKNYILAPEPASLVEAI